MLSKLIVSSYGTLLEIAIWVILVGSFIGGWASQGFLGALVSLLGAFVFSIVFFGAFLTLVDIQKSVRSIEERQKPRA
jgi:FtsH-binding integral membrane protein